MSLLLDALNKADEERKRNEAMPDISSHHQQLSYAVSHRKTVVTTALAVTGLITLLAGIYWLGQRSAAPTASTSTTNKAPAAAQPQHALTAPEPTVAVKSTPATKPASNTTLAEAESLQVQDDIDTSEEKVANLYQQKLQTQSTNATLTINTPVNMPETIAVADQASGSPTSINQFANLPDLHDLPTQVLEKIPSLNYSEHNYNANGGSVKINGVIRHANDQLAPGLVIDKILEDGMILHADNYSFKMRALNSWVNM